MKSIFKKIFAVVAVITIVTFAFAKETPLKVDPSIKQGKLSNGMTYFIKKNSEPQNRIFLRLVVKAGSVMEEENERGVAHFIEHLAFNGTEHFQKSEIVDWFEKIGMNFGNDLNAYTSFEETVYMLEIPADNPEMLKTAMLVLHDWASAVTFPQEEIEKERGVIQEEWRLRDLGVDGRRNNKLFPFMTKDSVFENRMPIGKVEVTNTITRDEILSFYKKWYRPEIMSVVVVGDADIAAIEKEIKSTMGTIPASKNPINVTLNRIPKNNEKQILVITDPEQKFPIFQVMELQERNLANFTEEDFFENLKLTFATNIFNIRADEITNTTASKWLEAQVAGTAATDSDLYSLLYAVPKEGMFIDSMKALFDEYERAMIHGVTESELQMIKSAYFANVENYLANKDKINSGNIISQIVNYAITGNVVQSVEDECKLYKKFLDSITVDDVNESIRNSFKDRGTKLVVVAPENYSDLPSEKELMDVWKNYKSEEVAAYTDDTIEKLMDKPAKKGKVKSKKKNKGLGTTEYVLENGIKIITKKTDFEKDTIIMQASSKGGTYQISDEDFPSIYAAEYLANYSGFNGLTYNQISKFLANKQADFGYSINTTSEHLTGIATNKDLEYLFQQTNLMFTGRQSSDDAWKIISDYLELNAKNHGAAPADAFSDKINELAYGDDLRHAPFDMRAFAKLNQKKAEKIIDERFANPADFTFVFVGDFNEKKLIELCQTYLGTLATTTEFEETKYLYWPFPKGKSAATVKKGIDEQGKVFIAFGGDLPEQETMESGFKETTITEQLASLLEIRLREVIREDNSGSYGISAQGIIDGYPERSYLFQIMFGCEPKRCEELSEAVINTIKEIQANGVSDDNIQKLREQYRRAHETNLRDNWWWMGKINAVSIFTYQPSWVVSDTEKVCEWITSENLQEAAKKYLDTENYICVFLKPE